jgi:hypothetical protein
MFTLLSFADLSIDAVVQYNKDSTFATSHTTTTSVTAEEEGGGVVAIVEEGISSSVGEPPSIVFLSICLLFFGGIGGLIRIMDNDNEDNCIF